MSCEPKHTICSNIERISEGIGDKFGLLIRTAVQYTAGLLIAFVWCWQMALPLSFLSPVIASAMSFSAKVSFFWKK